MNFTLGCNYWASNAGIEMWNNFDINAIKKDMKLLAEHGTTMIRIFPLWSDFQPVSLIVDPNHYSDYHFSTNRGNPETNPYFIDETMLERFSLVLDECEKYNIKVIVGLITGFMSGELYVPPALNGKNVITDSMSLYLQQLFIKGFVKHFKDREIIYAWDLGNECNCMPRAENRMEAASWAFTISNAIRAVDNTRPVISGMHGIRLQSTWTIQDQAECTDILTTHPYALWCGHTENDEMLSFRTSMHPTAQGKFFSEIGKRPCLTEEFGSLGPMMCSDENAAHLFRINALSLWANGSLGFLWWCNSDQTELTTFPYTHIALEQELGMIDVNHNPKPVLCEMKKFSENIDFDLPKAKTDAVCILTRDQDQWGVGYMTHILSRQAGFNVEFTYGDNEIPDAKVYLMPSVSGYHVIPKARYNKLREKVFEGADLYISMDSGVFIDFEKLTGMRVINSFEFPETVTATLTDTLTFNKEKTFIMEPTTAEVLCYDDNKNPLISVNRYGKGRVFLVNAPVEKTIMNMYHAFDKKYHEIYDIVFKDHVNNMPVKVQGENLIKTYHPEENGGYVVIINHDNYEKNIEITFDEGYDLKKLCYGNLDKIAPFDATVIHIDSTKK